VAGPIRLPERPFLYPILDVAVPGDRRPLAAIPVLAAAGVRLVQVRAKRSADGELLALAAEAVKAGRACGVGVIVNDRPDVALLADAAGVHLGQDDLPVEAARTVLGPDRLVGVSTHDLDQLRRADGEAVDYIAFGPVYPTRSKERPDPVVGVDAIARARPLTRRCLVAIGGIDEGNAGAVARAGADGVAVISALRPGDDLERRALALRHALAAGLRA
jgi:thiamine-phosphate pyrophosphorylase